MSYIGLNSNTFSIMISDRYNAGLGKEFPSSMSK
jgi:hypothetical protein